MTLSSKKISLVFFSLVSLLIFLPSTPALCANGAIAKLADFSGTVLIKSRGAWGIEPAKGLSLYSEDKVVTRIGSATVVFNDGAVLDIQNNSNVLLNEKQKGLAKKAEIVKRRILLFLGKLFFKTGKTKLETRFETVTAVVGIRGTAGILSIAGDGRVYIQFTQGKGAYFVGDLLEGEAEGVPAYLADTNLIQKAAFLADTTAEQCKKAEQMAARGEITKEQFDWICANADLVSASEVITWANAFINSSPDPYVIEWAEDVLNEAKDEYEEAKEIKEETGWKPKDDPEPYEPPDEESEERIFELDEMIITEPAADDLEPASKY